MQIISRIFNHILSLITFLRLSLSIINCHEYENILTSSMVFKLLHFWASKMCIEFVLLRVASPMPLSSRPAQQTHTWLPIPLHLQPHAQCFFKVLCLPPHWSPLPLIPETTSSIAVFFQTAVTCHEAKVSRELNLLDTSNLFTVSCTYFN